MIILSEERWWTSTSARSIGATARFSHLRRRALHRSSRSLSAPARIGQRDRRSNKMPVNVMVVPSSVTTSLESGHCITTS